jgi:hypothetical protein
MESRLFFVVKVSPVFFTDKTMEARKFVASLRPAGRR